MPYGQLLANQQATGDDERYKFTGKERDEETGYDYFGARYYWSLLKHWTTVDPLVDNYLHISPYAYCNWNPIKYVDPDGRFPDAIWDGVWIAWDGASFLYNTIVGNGQEAAKDAACFTADGVALFIPGMPAVSGPGKASAKLAPKVAESAPKVAKAIDKVITATKNTYRKALQKATGKLGKGYEAHHTLPQKHREKFEKLGINIDDPEHVVWRKKENHRAGNAEHEKAWDNFFESHQNYSKEEVLKARDEIENNIWQNNREIPAN